MNLRFATDLFPWLPIITALAVTLAYALDFYRRRRALEKIGHAPQLKRMMASLSRVRRYVKAVLMVLAVTSISVALSRPQREASVTWSRRGIDLVVAMDFSKSMLTRDVYPDRLTAMTDEVEELLDELKTDRVAVVAFAGAAAHFPLSHDHEAARSLFRGLTTCPRDSQSRWPTWCAPYQMPPGSNLGEAIMVSRCVLRPDLKSDPGCERVGGHGRGGAPLGWEDDEDVGDVEVADEEELAERARAIVLFTDGEDLQGTARAEVEHAIKLGIHVFIVGVGTTDGDLIPEYDEATGAWDGKYKKTADGKSFVLSRLDQSGLKELAEVAGGESRYFHMHPDEFQTAQLVKQLRRLKRGDLDGRVKKEWTDIFEWPLFIAFLLLLIEACISERKWRVVYPEEQV